MTDAGGSGVPVTVVIPARDAAATITGTLASILGQTAGAPHVIVVDDGSTDGTADLALAAGAAVTVIKGAALGPGAARNRGASRAATPYLAFCDADDRWPPDRLERDLVVLDADPTIGILLGRMRFDTDDDALLAHVRFDAPDRTSLVPHFGAATMRTAEFADVGPIDETLANYEDFEWFLRAREVPGRLVTHDRVTLWSWRHADSLSHQHPATTRDMLRLLQRQALRQRALGRDLPTLADLRREVP